MNPKIQLAIVWHMHQPDYRDPDSGVAAMPWVRLHAAKDYGDMPSLVQEFPRIRQTFNLTPVLIDQLKSLSEGSTDNWLEVSRRPAAQLSSSEKRFIISNFFMINWDHSVLPHPRYRALLEKRGDLSYGEDPGELVDIFTEADYLDLVALFNLFWIDSYWHSRYPELAGYAEKNVGFTEGDKTRILEIQSEIIKSILPIYRSLAEKGVIEVSTTPYFHPISPLLIDQNAAKEARPSINLPSRAMNASADAEWHIDEGIRLYRETFGAAPRGMWPAEGGVSNRFLELVASRGIQWVATDEGVLAESLRTSGEAPGMRHLEPCSLQTPRGEVSILFRDRELSDLIGFTYARWDSKTAAADLHNRIRRLGRSAGKTGRPPLVSIILDGENAWETYANDGKDFLREFYRLVSDDKSIECITPAEYLKKHPPERRLASLVSGSWINHDFSIWIGHPEDHQAWNFLHDTREWLTARREGMKADDYQQAWRHLMVAEGSDWTWWYGDEHQSMMSGEFDRLFRMNLAKVYRLGGGEAPIELLRPIKKEWRGTTSFSPATDVLNKVTIDGRITSYFEWLHAARYETAGVQAEMHRGGESYIERIMFGTNEKGDIFIRIDANKAKRQDMAHNTKLRLRFLEPMPYIFEIRKDKENPVKSINKLLPKIEYAWDYIIEITIHMPQQALTKTEFIAELQDQSDNILEQWPSGSTFIINQGKREINDWVV